MSTLNRKLREDFLHIPKLTANGKNWMMYKECLQWSIDAWGLLSHLDGTETKPMDPQMLPRDPHGYTPGCQGPDPHPHPEVYLHPSRGCGFLGGMASSYPHPHLFLFIF
ncbi:uncharacterized protein F5147DRAFT_576486 [Suillus discolor]|uniref:Uncharacterized protein n=1 Tax=Suillus discolor TaxID=1912936 RepID=A0A9P7JUB8_9AGAM|nr:uncharacterized protein F5147DRAFT_576486 [Suillus discolor]KAG2108667.1 hypothetical protein F5147DRAFT_576486 [Suillus discolor]